MTGDDRVRTMRSAALILTKNEVLGLLGVPAKFDTGQSIFVARFLV